MAQFLLYTTYPNDGGSEWFIGESLTDRIVINIDGGLAMAIFRMCSLTKGIKNALGMAAVAGALAAAPVSASMYGMSGMQGMGGMSGMSGMGGMSGMSGMGGMSGMSGMGGMGGMGSWWNPFKK